MIRSVKQTVFSALTGTKLHRAVANSAWRRERLAILCYHGFTVADEGEWQTDYYVPPEHLRRRLTLLRDEGYTVLPLGEAVQRLHAGSLPPRSVAITVDDGSADFYTVAAPLFEEFSVPVTLYLTSFHCLEQTPVFRFSASYILWKGRRAGAQLPELGGGWNLLDPATRERAADQLRIHARQNKLSQAERLALLAQLAATLDVDFDRLRRLRLCQLITRAEGEDLVRRGFDLQIHTHRHRTPADPALFQREIDDNRRILAELGMSSPTHFCYPSGEYRPEFLPWLQAAGIATATTCENNLASPQSHPLLLPRLIDTTGLTDQDFVCRLAGIVRSQEQRRFRRPGAA